MTTPVADNDDWPRFGEELARKSMTALEAALFKYENGEISKEAMRAVANRTVQGRIVLKIK